MYKLNNIHYAILRNKKIKIKNYLDLKYFLFYIKLK